MQEGGKQPLGHTAYELIRVYAGKLQEETEHMLYSNYFTVREILYKIQKEVRKK